MIKIRMLYWIYRWSRRLADYAENWADRLHVEYKGSLIAPGPRSQATEAHRTLKVDNESKDKEKQSC